MPLPPNPLINGVYPDFSRIELSSDTIPLIGVGATEISYSDKSDPGIVRGAQRQPLGITPGQYEAEGSITFHRRWYQEFVNSLAGGIYDTFFNLTVSYDMGDGLGLLTDQLIGCRLKSNEGSFTQGNDPLVQKLGLFISYILWDGKLPLDNIRL